VAALALLALPPATSWGAFPGANGLIAYSERGGTPWFEIFTISLAGGDPTRLTDNAVPDLEPSWSADGRRLAFTRDEAETVGQDSDVWTMRADGTHQRRVTHDPRREYSPSFSPDGGRILMIRNENIVIVRTDGTKAKWRTRDHTVRDAAFSPGGRRIVFSGAPREESPQGIWVMRGDGTNKRLLANEARDPEEPDYLQPDFSPDGSHIIFERMFCVDNHTCNSEVILMPSNGRRKRSIGGGADPAFSPNGHRIAAVRVSCGLENCGTRVISFARDGTDRRAVTPPGDLKGKGGPSWQPIPQP
jgi:TolB protein